MPAAIVTGATGMLGRQIVFELGRDPKQWSHVTALSRSQKEDYPENVAHNHLDLTSSAKGIAKELGNVKGEYLFFAAYLQKDSEQENWDVNGSLE
jgi:NAD(P)-dependent dehydrogenase (short-subunit alcohol dehydrogenase family)